MDYRPYRRTNHMIAFALHQHAFELFEISRLKDAIILIKTHNVSNWIVYNFTVSCNKPERSCIKPLSHLQVAAFPLRWHGIVKFSRAP